MELLHILEEKIARLIESKKNDLEMIAELNKELSLLKKENEALKLNLDKLENSLLTQDKNNAALTKENKEAKVVVDELISNIDALIKQESQS